MHVTLLLIIIQQIYYIIHIRNDLKFLTQRWTRQELELL